LYHTGELVDAIAARDRSLLRELTVCAIDREGPDTDATVVEWLSRFPELQVAAPSPSRDRLRSITSADLSAAPAFAKMVAGLLRPGGFLVQDIQLSTLPFIPADRWWESIYSAATVRGLFADRSPFVRFLSNKRGYAATFGRDLADAGFDPRDVIDKAELVSAGVPAIVGLVDRQFPLVLQSRTGSGSRHWRVSERDRADIEASIDLLLWPSPQGLEIGGRCVDGSDRRFVLRTGTQEIATWESLVADRLSGDAGVPVLSVGERVGPPDAGRAELTNVAARHIHTLRNRLTNSNAIVTANHAYKFADILRVGRVIVNRA